MIVYQILNKINNKKYIGQTSRSIEERWKGHLYEATIRRKNSPLYTAIRKHGAENFNVKVLCSFKTKDEMDDFEIFLISAYDTMNLDKGYNLSSGGEGSLGYHHSPEAIEKIRAAGIGHKYTLGRKHSPETRAKMSAAHIGNKYSLGHITSIETRHKQSIACRKSGHWRKAIESGQLARAAIIGAPIGACQRWNISRNKPCTCGKHDTRKEN